MAAKKHWHVKIIEQSGKGGFPVTGVDTKVLDGETGKAIPQVYRVKFESAPGELVKAEIFTYAVMTDIDTEATIIGTDPDAVLDTLKHALEAAGVSGESYRSVYNAVLELLWPEEETSTFGATWPERHPRLPSPPKE
jgi:hypothetical protein